MNTRSHILASLIIMLLCILLPSGIAFARANGANKADVIKDSLSVERLDSLLLPFVLEGRSSMTIKTKEDAHLASEQLLVQAAAGLSNEKRPYEDILASLVASLVSQRIKEEFNLVNDVYYAVLFQDQAIYYAELGFHNRALEKELKAMSILKANTKAPEFDEYYPDELERLADRYHKTHNLPQAIEYQKQANAYYLSHALLDYYGCGLFKCARYYSEVEDYRKVIECLNGFLSSMKKANEEIGLEDMSELLILRGGAYLQIGDISGCIKDAESHMVVSRALYGSNSLEYSNSLSNYATALTFADRYFDAKEYFKQALEILENKTEWGYDFMITCDQYSIALIELGEYSEAKKYSDYAIDYCLRNKIKDYDYAQVLINSSRCSSFLGDYDTSFALSKEALQVEKDLGIPEDKKNYGYYAALSSFAGDALATGHLDDAENACRVIIEEGERINVPAFIGSFIKLSSIELEKGNHSTAMDLAQKAVEFSTKYVQSELPAIGQLADCQLSAKQFNKAVDSYSRCVSIATKQYGESTFSTLYYKICLCFSLFNKGEKELVTRYVREINANIKTIATNGLLGMTNREKYFFLEKLSIWSKQILPQISASIDCDDITCELYDAVLYNKGLLVLQERINNIAMHQEGAMYNQLKEMSRQYNNRIAKGERNGAEARELQIRIESLEKELLNHLEKSLLNPLIEIRNNSSWEKIKLSLDNKDIAVEIVSAKDSAHIFQYYAILLSPQTRYPKLIHLFSERELPEKPQIKGVRPTNKELQYYEDFYEKVYTLLWQPLEEELKGKSRVFISPDRRLYAIGIEDATKNGKPLSETIEVKRVSSTLLIQEKNAQDRFTGQAVLFGGLNMNAMIANKDILKPESTISGIRIPRFTDISQSTLEEVLNVKNLLDKKNIHSNICTASDGTEQQFKELSEGSAVKLIHIATHGIFIPGQSFNHHNRDNSNLNDILQSNYNLYQSSMQRSALALSGANHHSNCIEFNDGILTAKEISDLYIPNLELTVLSACQTGQGEMSFDGIAGLQRGFKIAGSRTIVMSLWDVDSEVTTELMSLFYQEWLKGRSKNEAFRRAKKKIKKEHTNPYYWASFIMLD